MKLHYILILTLVSSVSGSQNLTEWTRNREKRYLIWTNSGSTKLGLSVSIPVNMHDKKKWRSFNMIFNFGLNYDMPQKAGDWLGNFNYWEEIARSMEPESLLRQEDIDIARMYIYSVLEDYMKNMDVNGRQCVQRAICENAQVQEGRDFAEMIYHRIMTPDESSYEHYMDAYIEGSKGVDCLRTYSKCPLGESLLDRFLQYK